MMNSQACLFILYKPRMWKAPHTLLFDNKLFQITEDKMAVVWSQPTDRLVYGCLCLQKPVKDL
jgi:hypothetical protein